MAGLAAVSRRLGPGHATCGRPGARAVLSLLCVLSVGCAALPEDETSAVDALTTPRPFCELSQSVTPSERAGWQTSLWSAATVQREIASVMTQAGLRCFPQGAYLAV